MESRVDQVYQFDSAAQSSMDAQRPWLKSCVAARRCPPASLTCARASSQTCLLPQVPNFDAMQHALAGVEAGQRRSSKPLEIMGLLLGKAEGDTIVVVDCFALPIEGTESRVVADDESVVAYMVKLSEQLEKTRNERFIGWYHSHPFDVESQSHCFLSSTDVSTQWSWQNTLTGKWIAIVVDPLRSLAKHRPEIGAFRCYPPSFSPPSNECPDGSITADENARQIRWGKSHNRYYQLEIEDFLSNWGRRSIEIMSRDHLWTRILSSTATLDPENRQRFPDRVFQLCSQVENLCGPDLVQRNRFLPTQTEHSSDAMSRSCEVGSELASELCLAQIGQLSKALMFNHCPDDSRLH